LAVTEDHLSGFEAELPSHLRRCRMA
jgi:hypothetical protein